MPKEERGFKYQKRSKDDIKERANMKGGNFDSYIKPKFKQWKPKEGKNLIRILPPTWDGARHYGLDIFVNFSIGADNQAYLSLSRHGKGEDPLAEAKREAQREGDDKLAKALNPTQRILYWIIDRADEDEGPLLWAAPFTFDKSLSNLCIDEDTKEVIFIDDPVKGRDVRFYKEGTGLATKYDPSKMKILPTSTLHEDEGQENEWLDFVADNPLPSVLNFYDYDHINAVFNGQIGKRDDATEDADTGPPPRRAAAVEDEAEERPVRKRAAKQEADEESPPSRTFARGATDPDKAPSSRKRSRPTDEDEDEDGEEQPRRSARRAATVVDEEVEKPKRRARPVVDDDEDDEDPPSTRRTSSEEGSGSLRERLAARRQSRQSEED